MPHTPPSEVFIMFIEKYPDSSSAVEWKKFGEQIPTYSGSFTKYLYAGDILYAIGKADMTNKARLKNLLFPRDPC